MAEFSMMTALIIIAIILINGASRLYFKRRFDTSEIKTDVAKAVQRHQMAKQRLINAHK